MKRKPGRPRKFLSEDELILAKRLLKGLIILPPPCVCGSNYYYYGIYSGSKGTNVDIIAKCQLCGYRRVYNSFSKSWGPRHDNKTRY